MSQKQIKKHQLQVNQLRTLMPADPLINEDTRTVTLTWSTGFKGMRSGWDGSFYEELSMDPNHVDMSRLQSGAPLLAVHKSQDLNSVIGVVERAWLEGNQGKAEVRFSTDPEADKIYQKVKEKILRNVSVGYAVRKYEDVTQKGESVPTYRATNWQPHEISIVPIGFDPNAQVRNQENILTEVEIECSVPDIEQNPIKEKSIMTDEQKRELELAAAKKATQEEKQRQSEIRLAVRAAKLEDSYAEELVNTDDMTADKARKLILEKIAAAQPPPPAPGVRVELGTDNADKKRQGFEEALLHRVDTKNFKLTDAAREFYGKSMLRQIEAIVPRHAMESDAVYAKRAMASSDLPLALANVAEKGLQKVYELQPRTFEQWTRPDTLRNYKEFSQIKTGDFGSLIERPENGEFKLAAFGEANEVSKLKDYGVKHAFSSQMLVNDDLGVITRLTSGAGIAVSRLENRLSYLALTTNKTMKDGVALYHATHGNLSSAAAIGQTSVADAYKKMRKQMSTDGKDPLNLTPKYFICGPDKEAEAKQFFSSVNATKTSDINIYQNSMTVIVDAQLSGNQYYFLADQNVVDTVVCYRLEGQEQPSIESRLNFDNNSLELKVAHSFVAAPMDWRGIVYNPGA